MRRIALLLATVALGACGESSLPRSAAADLREQVSSIRTAAEAGKRGIALGRLDALLDDATRLLERGVADEASILEIVAAAEVVRLELRRLEPSGSPSPSLTPSPSPEDEGDEEGDGHGKDKGKGNGKGKGNEGHGNDD